ncbi:MAG: adenosylcobinamide-GDP ribazoletransferase [Pseudomonadota bacterium]
MATQLTLRLQQAKTSVSALCCAVQFLSRIPVYKVPGLPPRIASDLAGSPNLARDAALYPIAGMIIALPAALVLVVLSALGLGETAPLVLAILTVAMLVLTTGALHEDGLADVADGFFGGSTVERKLAIMRDSTIGTYGTLALVLSVILRVACLASIIALASNSWSAAAIVLAIAGLSRGAMLWPWTALPPARSAHATSADENAKDPVGLSVRYGEPNRSALARAGICALVPLIFLGLGTGSLIITLTTAAVMVAAAWACAWMAKRHIGGHTGDVLGATQQTSECAGCLWVLIALPVLSAL